MREYPSGFSQKSFKCLPAAHFFHKKILLAAHVFHWTIFFLIFLCCICFQVSYCVYRFIDSQNNLDSNTQWSQRHNLYKTAMKKSSKTFCQIEPHEIWSDGREQTTLKNKEVLSDVCMCRVSTQQWLSTKITLFERTHQSAGLDAVTTPVDKEQVHFCVLQHLCLREFNNKGNRPKSPELLSPTRC